MTCLSFSIAKPFRRQIWTNMPFFISVLCLFTFNSVDLFVPGDTPGFAIFSCLPFKSKSGETYYDYRYLIAVGIVLNSVITYASEKIIVSKVTQRFDRAKETKKYADFDELMDGLQHALPPAGVRQSELETQRELKDGYS